MPRSWSWVTASRASLFISNTMTPEANPATFSNPVMWVLAQTQSAFGLSFPALFQVWRMAAILLLVPVLVAFVHVLVPAEARPVALPLALFGSGLGWVLVVAKQVLHLPDVPWPHDLYTVEPNTFWALLGYPNILIAQALVLATLLCAWLAYRDGYRWQTALASIGAGILSLSHAYDLITVYAVLGGFGLVEWLRLRRIPTRLLTVAFFVTLSSAPFALYYQRLTSTDPLWQSILAQYSNAGVWTPRFGHLVILMGVPLLLAGWGAVSGARWTPERRFLAVWAAVSLCVIYLPVVYQIKLLTAWQFPIAALAACAWAELLPARRSRLSSLATALLVVVASLTNVYLFAWRFIELRRHDAPYYLQRDAADALEWLSGHARRDDVVLAPLGVGQFVPNYGGSRAYLAHWAMTNRFFERRDNVDRFFDVATSEAWREQLLMREHVTLVLRPAPPDGAATYDPAGSERFELVFSRPRVQVHRVRASGTLARAAEGRPR